MLALGRTTHQPRLLGILWRVLDNFGFFSTDQARDLLNELLRDRIATATGRQAPPLVTFADLDPRINPGACSLKIIATNLSKARMELFDQSTSDVVVADAVAASFSIPVFFKPTRIRRVDANGRTFLSEDIFGDGGLVSNLPVWAFSEEKRSVERLEAYRDRRPLPIIAFTLSEGGRLRVSAEQASPFSAFFGYIRNVVSTGIFGGQSIVESFVPHLTVVDLPSPLTVVGFDCSATQAADAYRSGFQAANGQLESVFRVNPAARDEILEDLRADAIERSARLRRTAGHPEVAQMRVCLLRQLGNQSFKVIASLGMETDADDDLILDKNNRGGPSAFQTRDLTYLDVKAIDELRMTKYERALVRPTLASVISIPIFRDALEWNKSKSEREDPVGVFCLDSDSDLGFESRDEDFSLALAVGATRFANFVEFEREAL